MTRLPRMNPSHHGRLSYAVYQSELLTNLLEEGLEPLLDAYERAAKLAEEASAISFDADDAADEVRAALRTGAEVDVPAAVSRMAAARAAKADHEAAVTFFRTLPDAAHQEIRNFIVAHEDDLRDGLADQLSDVLDRAEAVAADLGNVHDGDAAIEAGVTDQWSAIKDLARTYHDIRAAQIALLRAEDAQVSGPMVTANAFFGGLAEVDPAFAEELRSKPSNLMGQSATNSPFDVLATNTLGHFRYVVDHRAQLSPHVISAEEALNPPTVIREDPMVVAAPKTMSDRDVNTMARIRRASFDRIAEERAEIAAGGLPA